MNDKHKEQLSVFVDNEIEPEALAQLDAGDAVLYRYQLMGDAIRAEVIDASLVDVSTQVKLAVENEPVHCVVHKVISQQSVKQLQTSNRSTSEQSWFDFAAWMRPLGGMAVAASVAIVLVMVINQPDTEGNGITGIGGQLAVDTRPVVSLPVNNIDHGIGKLNVTNIKNEDKSEEEIQNQKLKSESVIR